MVTVSKAWRAPEVQPVQPIWPGATVVCLGCGPSLTQEDVDYCRDRARVVAIKDAVRLAPWADALYSGDERWWTHYGPTLTFQQARFGLVEPSRTHVELLEACRVHRLQIGAETGVDGDRRRLSTGQHSGFQAINLAIHLGAARIVLLGYDMQASADGRDHFFGAHPYRKKPMPYGRLAVFNTLIGPLMALGVTVVNATRRTALACFPCVTLQEALA